MSEKVFSAEDLYKLICEVFGFQTETQIPRSIRNQINRFVLNDKMTPLEIARCIAYYTEELGKNVDKLYGIWFVPNVRTDADAHFKQLELEQQNRQAEAQKAVEYQDNNIIFHISSLSHEKRQPPQIDISAINVEEDN